MVRKAASMSRAKRGASVSGERCKPSPQAGPQGGQTRQVAGQAGGQAHVLLGRVSHQLGQTHVGQDAQPGPADRRLPARLTTGTPIHKESRLVV